MTDFFEAASAAPIPATETVAATTIIAIVFLLM
jgi:hypothetical protein